MNPLVRTGVSIVVAVYLLLPATVGCTKKSVAETMPLKAGQGVLAPAVGVYSFAELTLEKDIAADIAQARGYVPIQHPNNLGDIKPCTIVLVRKPIDYLRHSNVYYPAIIMSGWPPVILYDENGWELTTMELEHNRWLFNQYPTKEDKVVIVAEPLPSCMEAIKKLGAFRDRLGKCQ